MYDYFSFFYIISQQSAQQLEGASSQTVPHDGLVTSSSSINNSNVIATPAIHNSTNRTSNNNCNMLPANVTNTLGDLIESPITIRSSSVHHSP